MKVLKFGGSSLKDSERIIAVSKIIKDSINTGPNLCVVVSALGKTTNQLCELAEEAATGNWEENLLVELKDKHLRIIQDLNLSSLEPMLIETFNSLTSKLKSVAELHDLSDKTKDSIIANGELLSAQILAKYLSANFLDSREIIKTNQSYGKALVNFSLTNQLIQEKFTELNGITIVPGFIASTERDKTTSTLGRGGSDYSASIYAAALDSEQIEIWTDVSGFYTADPRIVRKAFPQEQISYPEAMELCHFGAQVLYPPAIQPAVKKNIPIVIKNSYLPQDLGTKISKNPCKTIICGLTAIRQISMIRIEGSSLIDLEGIASRIFTALASAKVNLILITQASSEQNISLAVSPEDTQIALNAINQELDLEIQNSLLKPAISQEDLAIISVVGEKMESSIGVAGKTFSALGKNGINIVAIAQGSAEINISAVIKKNDFEKALRVLHEEFFFPNTKTINMFLIGTGLIGKELIRQIKQQTKVLIEEHDHKIRLLGYSNSKKYIWNSKGLSVDTLDTENLEYVEEFSLDNIIKKINATNLPNCSIVDCTASSKIALNYHQILENNISVITPNKKAQSDKAEYFQLLKNKAKSRAVNFLYETSVGAGLPVISTLQDLIKSGDKILTIEGVLSGTLSYIFNTYDGSTTFAEVVKQAQAAGFTEPDPRDDLNGIDVARKILILAREIGGEIGTNLEMSDLEIENLVPESARATDSIEDFYQILKSEDSYFSSKIKTALKNKQRLRYIAEFDGTKAKVSLAAVDADHPFYSLNGSDNTISFTTSRYHKCPLVIKGPGAGAAVTAAGVFADAIRLAEY